ncbi:MAG: glycosyltransferase, partial [Merismopedia sp. SIO2A8]|nr:glycosyltransferase [Merismopedia sp. SIO2A8]
AENLQEYWQNIIDEVDCITDVPPSYWDVDDYYDPDPRKPDKTYCKRGGFIPEIDFNPMEFGLPPNLLEVTDVSQLLSLVIAKQAMEDAGYGQTRDFNRDHTGVILGAAVGRQIATPFSARLQFPIWERALKNSGLSDEDTKKIVEKISSSYVQWNENAFPGMLSNIVAGRIANRLDFGGTNCTLDAACASSLACLNSVTFTGMLTGQLKYAALAAANLYVAPSYSEGFSMSVLEGMASGLPCVITKGCNFPEAAAANAAHVVDIKSEAITNALIECLNNPQQAKAMGDRAHKLILEKYTWEQVATKMHKVYTTLVNKNRSTLTTISE